MNRWSLVCLWFICQACHVVASLILLYSIITNPIKAKKIVLGYDRLGNAMFNGSDRESISSRAGRGSLEGNKGWCVLCKVLDWFDKDHCTKSIGT